MILALLYLAASAFAFWLAYYMGREARKVRDWPIVYGTMLDRGVDGMGQRYRPRIKYTYSVASKEYVSDQLYALGRPVGMRSTIQKLIDSVPDPVPVRYNPQDPSRSYLLANPRLHVWLTAAVGVIALFVGLAQLVVELAR